MVVRHRSSSRAWGVITLQSLGVCYIQANMLDIGLTIVVTTTLVDGSSQRAMQHSKPHDCATEKATCVTQQQDAVMWHGLDVDEKTKTRGLGLLLDTPLF